MTLPLDEDSRPPYLQAAAALRDAILTGEFTSGERLPSANVLGERFGVSSSTVQNALRVLKQEGLVYSQLGRGSFVSSTASEGDAPATSVADADGEEPGADWPADLIRNDDGRPPYVQVADFLRRDIAEGTYPPGSQLPPAREIQERFQVANSTAQNAYRSLKQEGLVYSVKGRGVFVRQAPEPGKRHGPITNYLLREEIVREARAAAADFADLTDDELLAREAELDQRWATIREEHQRIFNERRKIKRETSRRGLFLPPLHDDDADSDASPREKLEAALAESKKRRQQRP
ncbi:GntR family transcriptional regulator [Streptomyces sp. NPDC002845]